jgi:hypothetical protein
LVIGICLVRTVRCGVMWCDVWALPSAEHQELDKALSGGKGLTVNLDQYDPHDVAKSLKKFLNDAEPLFTFKLFDPLVVLEGMRTPCLSVALSRGLPTGRLSSSVCADAYASRESEKIDKFHLCIGNLPQENKDALCHLFNLFALICHNSAVTKMSAKILAYTCGPWLLRVKDITPDAIKKVPKVNNIMETIINHHERVWANLSPLCRPASHLADHMAGGPPHHAISPRGPAPPRGAVPPPLSTNGDSDQKRTR